MKTPKYIKEALEKNKQLRLKADEITMVITNWIEQKGYDLEENEMENALSNCLNSTDGYEYGTLLELLEGKNEDNSK